MRKDFDTQVAHSDNIWRSSAGARSISIEFLDQTSIVIRHYDANTECASDEEDTISPVGCFESALHSLARIHCLASDHRQIFRTDDGEGGLEQGTEKSLKAS